MNKDWIEDVEKTLKDLFDQTHIHYYKHWKENTPVIDINYELTELTKVASTLEPYIIFAKSAGTILAAKGIQENKLHPQKCIFTGVPIRWGRSNISPVDVWFKNYSTSTLFIQQTADPMMSYEELTQYLKAQNASNYITKEIMGDNHHYANLEELRRLMREFI